MNEQYAHKNMPLNKGIARALICELYAGQGYMKKSEIEKGILQYHLENDGKQPEVKLGTTVTRILSELEKQGRAEKHGESVGYWQILLTVDGDIEEEIPSRLEELTALKDRIERLEKVLLLVLSSEIGNLLARSPEEYLASFQTFPLEQMEKLISEYGSSEKVIESFPDILKEKHDSQFRR